MGDPLNPRLTGIVINQPDLPWWAVGILNWLAMVHAIQQATGESGVYRETLKQCLEHGAPYTYDNEKTGKRSILYGPSAVYGVYQSYCLALDNQANK